MAVPYRIIRVLQWIHLSIFLLVVGTITLLHLITKDFFDFLRLPQFLRTLNPLLGFGWPVSLHVYQAILVFFLLITLTDGLGLLFYRSKTWRLISDVSSFLGFLIIWPTALFFLFSLASSETLRVIDIQTAILFFIFAFLLFLLDLVTWFVDEQSFLGKRIKR